MKKLFLFPVLLLSALACSAHVDGDDDDKKTDTNKTDIDCRAKCTKEKDDCVKACNNAGDCVTACTDDEKECTVDCD
jgi:hypothetical protein